jgi:LysM repeat protein
VLGNMAITGQTSASRAEEAPQNETSYAGASYTVQRGDYLTALAERFGTTWQALAAVNNIGYPYTIYPGQILSLPGGAAPPEQPPPPEPTPTLEPSPVPTLVPTPTLIASPAPTPPPLALEEIRYRVYLPEIGLGYQSGQTIMTVRGRPRQQQRK